MVELFKTQSDFDEWLSKMDQAVIALRQALPEDVRDRLDYTPASLDVLEAWLLTKYRSGRELLAPSELAVWDAVGRYIGETFRRELGGHWDAVLDDPKYVSYRLPRLTGFSRNPTPVATHILATTALHRQKGDFLRTVLENVRQQEARWK